MAKIGVGLKIKVNKIEKERLFKGANDVYLDATVFIDTDQKDEYGNNGMVTQDVTREEKEQGVKGPILGNCRVFWQEQVSTPQPSSPAPQAGQALPDDDDDIPF
jgi:hypothetical protein